MMKLAIAFVALFVAACAGAERSTVPILPDTSATKPIPVGDSCSLARPDFGGVAADAERSIFAYDATAPLNLQKTLVSKTSTVETSSIAYTSPAGGWVTGLLFEPVGRTGLRPGMVLMHGAPGNAGQMQGWGQVLAGFHGAVAIAIDAPFARRGGEFKQYTSEDRTEQIQLIKDLQRAVDVLRSLPSVDAERIAYHGVSYGGAMGALFVGIERRLKAAVLDVADGGLVTHYTSPQAPPELAQLSCAARVNWFRVMVPIEPIRFIPHASPTALLLQNGWMDNLVSSSDAQDLHAAAPEPKTVKWYNAGHSLNQEAAVYRANWLHQQIGIDPLP